MRDERIEPSIVVGGRDPQKPLVHFRVAVTSPIVQAGAVHQELPWIDLTQTQEYSALDFLALRKDRL